MTIQNISSVPPKIFPAMPQLIQQDQLSMAYVNGGTTKALNAYRYKHLTKIALKDSSLAFYHYKQSSLTGVFFAMSKDLTDVAYLYSYTRCVIGGKPKAAEALAYRFLPEAYGLMKEAFFSHLLPIVGFVVTDYMYTPDGHKWFMAEYRVAFSRGYNVYAVDLTSNNVTQVTEAQFDALQTLYWGDSDKFQNLRFAIEYTSSTKG